MKIVSIPASDVSSTVDISKVNQTVNDSFEPHPFRGDNNDRLTIPEWEDSVKIYLSKGGIDLCNHVEVVLSKLQGIAFDVVKVGLRSKPSVELKSGPQLVFDILRQHFSDSVTTSMPLAYFYDTKPYPAETAADYWIRLNKAINIVGWTDETG